MKKINTRCHQCFIYIFYFITLISIVYIYKLNNNYNTQNINNNISNFYINANRIKKCFSLTKKVTCARNSNRLYIKKRKSNPSILLLNKHNHNKINFPFTHYIFLVAIITEPNMFYERNVFRKIYIKYKYLCYVFIMGKSNNTSLNKKIENEIKKNNDIIQFNFLASYFSLILQTYNILLWCSNLHIYFKWLIKHDTDTFFNIHLFKDLQNNINNIYLKYIWGYILKDFPSGMGYAIPYNNIKKLLISSSPYINYDCYGPAEDVFIGKIAKKSSIILYDFRNFNISIGEGSCIINNVNNFLMIHRLKPTEIYFLHEYILGG